MTCVPVVAHITFFLERIIIKFDNHFIGIRIFLYFNTKLQLIEQIQTDINKTNIFV